MEGKVILAIIFGWALLPFVLSAIYGCTSAGKIRIAPMMDILALVVGAAAFAGASIALRGVLADVGLPAHWGAFLASILGHVGTLLGVTLSYKLLYAGKPRPTHAH
ncbi:MAG: hypothetical protein H6807_02695 [Planctomycetes bacterium]|nr:hypothetical protein [Planctomycetota bacterium]